MKLSENLFSALGRIAPNRTFFSVIMGGAAGCCYALLIPLVLASFSDDPLSQNQSEAETLRFLGFEVVHYRMALVFLIACLLIIFTKALSQVLLIRVSIELASDTRTKIFKRIISAPIDQLEKMGSAKLIATLTSDVPRIVIGAGLLPELLISSVSLLGVLSFLLYLNPPVFSLVLGAIAAGAVSYQIPMFFALKYYTRSRQATDDLHEAIRGLILGAKELKLSEKKQQDFLSKIASTAEQKILKHDKRANTFIRTTAIYGEMINFFIIGIIVFVFVNYRTISKSELAGITMALLYITGPIATLLNLMPQYLNARISLNKLNHILNELCDEQTATGKHAAGFLYSVKLSDIYYQYPTEKFQAGARIGPINLILTRGQITYIVGGNGSGKSTLAKLLTLHYKPCKGTIAFNDTAINLDNISSYRNSIYSIYSDYHIFDKLLNLSELKKDSTFNAHVESLKLNSLIDMMGHNFSSQNLSDGQRRRMALLCALMEDKDFFMFDEWAADQDPAFKKIFYEQLLPALRKRKKLVVVITHDDRYFSFADQIVTMEDGELKSFYHQTQTSVLDNHPAAR